MKLNRDSEGVFVFKFAVVAIVALAVLIWIMFQLDAASCSAKWEGSGRASRYGAFEGCRVEVAPGRWVPDNTVRELNQ